ncbi:MAG TPA: NAD(P)-binding domain-containing protein, partial [Novosphingobium sp.]|nr:NAD(P)-binding domain-containing protein [Novosphingobium sp.]
MTCDIALIGFGEAGSTFAKAGDWRARARGWDRLSPRTAAMAEAGIAPATNPGEALAGAPLVLSLVTADQALAAAKDYAPLLAPGALWCDGNSVAPETKRAAARAVEAAGARYVDLAILAPVDPARLAVPLLLAGAAAGDAAERLRALGFTNLRIVGG